MDPELVRVYFDMAWPVITGVSVGLLILVLGWMASKWAQRIALKACERAKVDRALARFLSQIARYTVLAATGIAALGKMGVETTSLIAVFGAAGLAVGLALQGSLSNFASGVMILFFRPFDLEDKIEAAGRVGVVTDIGLFSSSLLTADNQTIIIPNAAITGGTIVNITKRGTLRGSIPIGVAYGSDLAEVQRVCLEAAKTVDKVLADPAPAIAFTEMASSSLNFNLMCWSTCGDYLAMLHEVRSACYQALEREGIEIPFDQIVIHQSGAA